MVNRRIRVQIMPRMSLRFPSMMSAYKLLASFGSGRKRAGQRAFWADVRQLDATRSDELEGLVNILCLLYTHSGIPIVTSESSVAYRYTVPSAQLHLAWLEAQRQSNAPMISCSCADFNNLQSGRRHTNDGVRTMSCISLTPSERSLTREVIGGYPADSSFVLSLHRLYKYLGTGVDTRDNHEPFTEGPLLRV